MRLNKAGRATQNVERMQKNWESHKKLGPNKSSTTASTYRRRVPCLSNPSRSQLIGGHPYPSRPASYLEFNEIAPIMLRLLLTSGNLVNDVFKNGLKLLNKDRHPGR